MSLQEKFDSALALLNSHNDAIGGKEKTGFVNPERFLDCIKASGGTSEERLKGFSYEDILNCLPISANPIGVSIKPVPLAKDIAKVFRGKSEDEEKRPIGNKKADKMTLKELVENFDPEDLDNSVTKRLKEIAKDNKFIVYVSGRTLDIESTFKILKEIKDGFGGRDNIDADNQTKKVYKIGELPNFLADENPLYPSRKLRPDGTCDQTGRSWDGVPFNVRQLIRVAIDINELVVDIDSANNVIDMAISSDAFTKLRKRYRNSSVRFDELAETDDLPKLKVPIKKGGGHILNEGKKINW
jgi:hypothetical protein